MKRPQRTARLLGSLPAIAAVAAALPGLALAQVPPIPLPAVPPSPIDNPLTQSLGPQPGRASQGCTVRPLAANEFRIVQRGLASVVDPWLPCRLYHGETSVTTSAPNLVRIEAGHIVPVLIVPSSMTPFSVGDIEIPRPGQVMAVDTAGAAGVLSSVDAGWHWRELGRRLPVSAWPAIQLAVAPSDPRTAYLATGTAGSAQPAQLAVTHDGGDSWALQVLPPGGVQRLAVDPRDPLTLFVLDGAAALLWSSHDGGTHWTPQASPDLDVSSNATSSSCRDGLVVSHPPSGMVLYVQSTADCMTWHWRRSIDGGASWSTLPLPDTTDVSALVADPRDGNRLVWADYGTDSIRLAGTENGFATRVTRRLALPPGTHLRDPAAGPTLQADMRGDFYLDYREYRDGGTTGTTFDDVLVGFAISAITGSGTLPPPPLPPPTPLTTAPPALPPTGEEATCALPGLANVAGGAQYPSGALTFDGRYLDYSEGRAAPGMIARIDGGCHAAAPLQMRPADFPSGRLPVVWEVTYDPHYVFADGTPGAILATSTTGSDARLPSGTAPVYAVNPLTGASVLRFGVFLDGTTGTPGGAYTPLFTYDFFLNQLWSFAIQPDGQVAPGLVDMAGYTVPTCMTGYLGDWAWPSSAAVGSDGILYVQQEDDYVVLRVDSRTCTTLGGFQHRRFSEPGDENEQIACDPVTFEHRDYSVLWIRDSDPHTVSAYRIPDGYCPFPTELTYDGPSVVMVGTRASLCAVLDAETAGTRAPLGGHRITFSVAGQNVGSGITSSDGRACITTPPLDTLGTLPVIARFDGTHAYLPAQATGSLRVVGTPPATAPAPPRVIVAAIGELPPPPNPLPAPATQPQLQPGTQAVTETQAQTQAQAQSQTQAQAHTQVGMAPQRQRQTQVAMQTARARQAVALQAVSLRRGPRTQLAAALAASTLLTGLVLQVRRRWRIAPASRGRHRP